MQEHKQCLLSSRNLLPVEEKNKHCEELIHDAPVPDLNPDPASIINLIKNKKSVSVHCSPWKPLGMFGLMNIAICLSVTVVTLGDIRLALIALALGIIGPFVTLFLSKFMAKHSFGIKVIDPKKFKDENEEKLYGIVEALALKSGLKSTPEVGTYTSPDMNAFATGHSQSSSLVAFSSALTEKMDEEAIAAVAAHEIAHIANGDMLSMTVMESVINTVVILIDIGLFFVLDDEDDNFLAWISKTIIRWIITGIFMFLGNLLALWFSRHREFKADKLAAELVSPGSMTKALNKLREDEHLVLPDNIAHAQQSYAAFKISSATAALDIFSTHPALERRIERLQQQH
ncbi:MAG: M48 family metalloprotease [Victivallales bacterium]|nr:M48 family metalloprotease [Victivallales bacterium]